MSIITWQKKHLSPPLSQFFFTTRKCVFAISRNLSRPIDVLDEMRPIPRSPFIAHCHYNRESIIGSGCNGVHAWPLRRWQYISALQHDISSQLANQNSFLFSREKVFFFFPLPHSFFSSEIKLFDRRPETRVLCPGCNLTLCPGCGRCFLMSFASKLNERLSSDVMSALHSSALILWRGESYSSLNWVLRVKKPALYESNHFTLHKSMLSWKTERRLPRRCARGYVM